MASKSSCLVFPKITPPHPPIPQTTPLPHPHARGQGQLGAEGDIEQRYLYALIRRGVSPPPIRNIQPEPLRQLVLNPREKRQELAREHPLQKSDLLGEGLDRLVALVVFGIEGLPAAKAVVVEMPRRDAHLVLRGFQLGDLGMVVAAVHVEVPVGLGEEMARVFDGVFEKEQPGAAFHQLVLHQGVAVVETGCAVARIVVVVVALVLQPHLLHQRAAKTL